MTKLEIGVMLEQNATFYFIMVTFFIMKNGCYYNYACERGSRS